MTIILNEFIQFTRYNPSYAARTLRIKEVLGYLNIAGKRIKYVADNRKIKRKKKIYDEEVFGALRKIWKICDYICSKRLAPYLEEIIPVLERWGEIKLKPKVREKLFKISAATIDRMFADTRKRYRIKGRATTKPGTLLKKSIPIRTFADWDEKVPGFFEVDLVSHDGGATRGDFNQSLNFTDICTGWEEMIALKNKAQVWVFAGEWRDDQRDSLMLSKMLKLKDHINSEREKVFIKIEKPSPLTESLRLLSRHQQTLIDEKVRLTNRLRKKLLEVCPQILKLAKLKNKKIIVILAKYPDFSKYKRITLKSLLKIKGIGKKGAPFLLKRLNNIEYVPGLTDIYKTIILSYAQRILELREEIKDIDKKLDEIGNQSKEGNHLKTIPGVATKLASRFIGEIGDINRFPSGKQLAVYCGVACVNNNSGKVTKAKAVYKANKICKQTLITMAGGSIRLSLQCKAYYLKKRMDGKSHNHTLRCLARQLIKVIHKMLTEDRGYIIRKELKKAA